MNQKVIRDTLQAYIDTNREVLEQETIDVIQMEISKLNAALNKYTSRDYLDRVRNMKPALDQHVSNFFNEFNNNPQADVTEYDYELTFGGKTHTIEFTAGSTQAIEQMIDGVLADAIDNPQPITVPVDGFESLINSWTYRMLVIYGRDLSLGKFLEIAHRDGIIVPRNLLRAAYQFACDLYDDNESNGNNDEMYPNRKR